MKRIATTLLLVLFAIGLSASDGKDKVPRVIKKAEQSFIEFDFFEALDGFLAAHYTMPEDAFVVRRIADCHRLLKMKEEALSWYQKLLDMGGFDERDFYYMSEVQRDLNLHEAALNSLREYQRLVPDDSRANRIINAPDFNISLSENDPTVNIEPMGVNDRRSVSVPTKARELLLVPIATEIDGPWYSHRRNLIQYQMYQTSVDDMYNLVSAEPVVGDINSKFSEGPACYDSKREVLMVTRFLTRKGRPALDETGHVFAMILSYRLKEGQWVETDLFPHNGDLSSAAYPTLSPDGNTLYFSANREDSFGGMDLYYCEWDDQFKEWGNPRNLGKDINTEGNEIYPQFAPDGSFSFSSDGHPGLGGLDIFFADLKAKPMSVRNPGMPFNTINDDFGLMYVGEQYGYFCSDRSADTGGDDLFWWENMSEMIEATIVLLDKAGTPMYPETVRVKNVRNDQTSKKSGLRGNFTTTFNGKDPYEITWNYQGTDYTMFCRPEITDKGLSYAYSTPENEFVAHAKINSYKESALRRKKVPVGRYEDKNITDNLTFTTAREVPLNYLAATWNGGLSDTPPPVEDTKVYLKNLETGEITASKVKYGQAEFEVDPDQLHAMTWTDAAGHKVIKYLKPDPFADSGLAFTEGSPCHLSLNEEPLFAENQGTVSVIRAALSASLDSGAYFEEVADNLVALVESGRPVTVENGATRIHAEDVYFGFDKHGISSEEKRKLSHLTAQLGDMRNFNIEVIAHTDSRGSKWYNEKLSRSRADATKRELEKLGFDPERITIEWMGEEAPVNDCVDGVPCDPKAHKMNRRAEVYIVMPPAM